MTRSHSRPRTSDLFEVIRDRSTVRSFQKTGIDRGLVIEAIEAAGWAPSPHGTQPWRFVIVEDTDDRFRLAASMGAAWREQLRLDATDEEIIEMRVRRSQERLERAPVVVVLCLYLGDAQQYPDIGRQRSEELMAIQSLGAAAQNFLLALHVLGLDSGWMCAPLFCPEVVRYQLGLGPEFEPHAMFPVGRMATPPRRRPRKPVADLIVPVRAPH